MLLEEILDGTGIVLNENQKKIKVQGIKIDSEKLSKGDLFFDLKGDSNINKVLEKGASFVVRYGSRRREEGKFVVGTEEVRRDYALASKNFYGKAADKLKLIGITGTNGKTSTTKLVADILRSAGKKVGTIGTMGCEFLGTHIDTGFTTPDPHILHSLLQKMQKRGVEYVVMEVSAHAIALEKLEGLKFEVLALTNITQDHLDFFKDMENYANTKLSFFDERHAKQGIVCIDDPRSIGLAERVNIPIITYGVENPSDIFAIDIESSFAGSKFICNCLDEVFRAQTMLVGDYNILNSLCAVGITNLLGLSIDEIFDGLSISTPEVGRFNTIDFNGVDIVIDYAHTPDGLEKVLQSAKSLCKGQLVLLFGCGGNRDKLKRPIMGSIASLYADKVFLTSDNPRFEKPLDIIFDIEKGMTGTNYEVEEDRKIAIKQALSYCEKGDCLIIAGKGGEKYQDINGEKLPYSDFEQVYNYFRNSLKVIDEKGRRHGS